MRKEAILDIGEDEYPDMSNDAQYLSCHLPSHNWLFFPRVLSAREYANPYLVFNKIARYGEEEKWKFLLAEIQDYCFFNSSFAEYGDEVNSSICSYFTTCFKSCSKQPTWLR